MALNEDIQDEDASEEAARSAPVSILITDPRLEDNPITFVNEAFEKLTLYAPEFALGRDVRFLQGPETHPDDAARIRAGLATGKPFEADITHHRADGVPYRVRLSVDPIHGADGALSAQLWVQRPLGEMVTAAPPALTDDGQVLLKELQHRVKNHLAMIASMVRIQARGEASPEALHAVSRRIEALSLLYEDLLAADRGGASGTMEAGAYLGRVAAVVSSFQADAAIRVDVDCDAIWLGVDRAACLGLLLSEFLTNALVHAFEGRSAGRVDVRFTRRGDGGARLTVADDGIGLPAAGAVPEETQEIRRSSGVGGSIVAALAASLGGTLDVASSPQGTTVTVEIDPAD